MSTVHMVSTTATEEEIKQALVRNNPDAEQGQDAQAASAAGETQEEKDSQEKPHKKGGFQRKIERLEAQIEEKERLYREALDRLEGKSSAPKTEANADIDPEPQESDFAVYKDFVKAVSAWSVRQEAKKYAEKQIAADVTAFEQQIDAEYQERVEEFKKTHPDFDEILDTDIVIPAGVIRAMKEMDNGPAVAVFLAQNPEVAKKMMEMSPLKAIAEAGKLSAKLAKPETPAPKPKSTAPAPITPVGGSSASTSTGTPGKRSLAEYRRLREEGRI